MKTAEQRKAESLLELQRHDVPYIDWLPHIESADEACVRSVESIAQRAIACLITIQAACNRNNDSYNCVNLRKLLITNPSNTNANVYNNS